MSTAHTFVLVLIIAFFCFFAIAALIVPDRDAELFAADVRSLSRMSIEELRASIRQRVRRSLSLRRLGSAAALVEAEGLSESELLVRIEQLLADGLKDRELGADATLAFHECGLGRASDELARRIAGGAIVTDAPAVAVAA